MKKRLFSLLLALFATIGFMPGANMDYASAEAEYIGEFAVEEEIVSDDVDLLITEVDLELGEEEPETADDAYVDADFGDLEDFDGEVVMVEDEAGNYLWEK